MTAPNPEGIYGACPHCNSPRLIRHGRTNHVVKRPRLQCKDCGHTFAADKNIRRPPRLPDPLRCYRCGSVNTKRKGGNKNLGGGAAGFCFSCRRNFCQGGKRELEHGRLHLIERVKALNLPAQVAAEVLNQACLDVLQGKGYCWNINLDTKRAWEEVRPHFYGSSSDVYLTALGEKRGSPARR